MNVYTRGLRIILKKYFILTEAGGGVGFGHISRMAVLRNALRNRVANIELRVKLELTTKQVWAGEIIPSDDWTQDGPKDGIVIVDSYRLGLEALAAIRAQNSKLIYMDDFGRLDPPCDLVINANLGAESFVYRNAHETLAGSSFVILQEGIVRSQKKMNHRNEIHKILISVGGSEIKALFDSLEEFCKRHPKLEFKILVPWLTPATASPASNIEFLPQLSSENLAKIMIESDLVLSAAGQTTHELAYLGVPFVAFSISKDQEPKVEYLLKSGLQKIQIKMNSKEFSEDLDRAISQLASVEARKAFAQQSIGLIDAKGVERMADRIINLS